MIAAGPGPRRRPDRRRPPRHRRRAAARPPRPAPKRSPSHGAALRPARGRSTARTRLLLLAGARASASSAGCVTGWVARARRSSRSAAVGLPVLLSRPRPRPADRAARGDGGMDPLAVRASSPSVSAWSRRSSRRCARRPRRSAPEVTRLVARLRARWDTEDALRAFADELDDATGDLIAANLILGARRRGAGAGQRARRPRRVGRRRRTRPSPGRGRPGQAASDRALGHPDQRRRPRRPRAVRGRTSSPYRSPIGQVHPRRCCSRRTSRR